MASVLLIDDDPQIRDLWAEVLTEGDIVVRQASTGVEGLRLASSQPFDVIVTDLIMPEKDGIETLIELKSARPDAKVVVVSGSGSALDGALMAVARELGASDVLPKPVDIDLFYSVVTELIAAD